MTNGGDIEQLEELSDLLQGIDSPGIFACGFEDTQAVHPGLFVEGVGVVALPLQPEQAKVLQSCCQAAPFGRGEQTLWDPAVRRTWQLEPSRIGFNNPDWQAYVDSVTSRVAAELGVDSATVVKAELYKLLLYQEGDHFVPHRDTEKSDGMFATMTILLPSQHMGGQLVVHHANQSKEFNFGAANGCSVCCAAFYADCKHELKPVQSGFRLALVYNLIHASDGPTPALKDCSEVMTKITKLVQAWTAGSAGLQRAIWMLEHKYSEAGLQSLSNLKNKDRAVAAVLQHLASSGCLDVHIVFVSKHEMGSAEGYDDDWCMDEVYETDYTAKGWLRLDGNSPAFKEEVAMEPGEILQGKDFFDDMDADEEECEEATGNEGATMNRLYHRAALMIWPRAQRWQHMCLQSLVVCMSELAKHAQAMQSSQRSKPSGTASGKGLDSVQLPSADTSTAASPVNPGSGPAVGTVEACRLAEAMWSKFGPEQLMPPTTKLPLARFSHLLSQLRMHGMVSKLADKLQNMALSRDRAQDIVHCAAMLGWDQMLPTMLSMTKAVTQLRPTPDRLDGLARGFWAVALLQDTWKSDQPAPQGTLASMCHMMADRVIVFAQQGELVKDNSPNRLTTNTGLIVHAAKAMTAFRSSTPPDSTSPETVMEQMLERLVNTYLKNPRAFPPVKVLVPACLLLAEQGFKLSESKPMLRLMLACEQKLEQAKLPQEPKDWVINVQVRCRCSDCCKLQAFLLHPTKRVEHFKTAKKHRAHVHRQIDTITKDVSHETSYVGNPQTLVCTKNRTSHSQKVKGFEQVTAMQKKLKRLIAQVMADVPAELRSSLLPSQQQQTNEDLAHAQAPLEQTLTRQAEACRGLGNQQTAAVIDLTDDVEPASKRHCA